VCVSDEAHRQEHSLEVQLPFLQYVLGEFSLVPVVVGRCAPHTVAAAMDTLWDEPGTLLIVSTDLSHFHSYDDARHIDTATCQQLLARSTSLDGEQACGAHALNGLMHSARRRSLQVEMLDLCNSGDTAGDRERVVGYGSFRLH
jgi:AmmeMemoRadiSam system protein B